MGALRREPAGPGKVAALTLAVPPDAEPGAYWSDVTATAQPGTGGQAALGAAATTAIVFTVGPSSTAPPPCGALDLAQSTGRFPPWPTRAFATTGMQQALAREDPPAPEETDARPPPCVPAQHPGRGPPAVA